MMPRLPIFLAEYPALDVDVVGLQDGDVDLIEAGIDVALRMDPLRDSALTGGKIGRCPMRVVGTPAYFAATGVPQAPTNLPASGDHLRAAPRWRHIDLPAGSRGNLGYSRRPGPRQRGERCSGGGARRPWLCHRL
jgi:DNA-binding transcriptional LysR family regulator